MPIYPFIDQATGQRVELSFPMGEAPSIGSTVVHEGRTLKRLCSDFVLNTDPLSSRWGFASRSLAKWHPDCKHAPDGSPIIESKEHAAMLCEKHGYQHQRDD